MRLKVVADVRTQRFGHHHRSQIRASDADVDDVRYPFSREASPCATSNGVTEGPHLFEDGIDFRHDVLAIHEDGTVASVAKCHMQNGTILRCVDPFTSEHGIAKSLDTGLVGEPSEQRQRVIGDSMLGEIDQEVLEPHGIPIESIRIGIEQIPHVNRRGLLMMGFQFLPYGRSGDVAFMKSRTVIHVLFLVFSFS